MLWASKSDCEASEECLMIQILTVLGTPFESIFDCDTKSPKQWCKVVVVQNAEVMESILC